VLKRRKNKEGVSKEERLKEVEEWRKEKRKKERKKERKKLFRPQCERDKKSCQQLDRDWTRFLALQSWVVVVLLTKPLFGLYKNYRILNWTKYSHVHKFILCDFVVFASHSAGDYFRSTQVLSWLYSLFSGQTSVIVLNSV
jgi:hypothetical protein